MANKQLRLAKVRLESIKKLLQPMSSKEKSHRMSVGTANDFNLIRGQIITLVPESEASLPSVITADGIGADDLKIADGTFLDLAVAVDQAIAVIDVLDSDNE